MSLFKKAVFFVIAVIFFSQFFLVRQTFAQATTPTPAPEYEVCQGSGGCLQCEDNSQYQEIDECKKAFSCANDLNEWQSKKSSNFWVNDPEVTSLGLGGERSREFLYWTLTHPSVEDQQTLRTVWQFSLFITLALLVVIAAIMGIGIIIGQKRNFGYKIEVSPLITKIGLLFLYAVLSWSIILLIIQISDLLMRFFIETLGVKDLFNIFFISNGGTGGVIGESEAAYRSFQGCRNISTNVLESVRTSMFLIKFTNLTYYLIGVMMILRKIVLWFLLFVAPFLAVLMPFVFIRNIGWIWIGVFFQWVFYGPLFALFLGGMAKIWNSPSHIPFIFDFSRTHTAGGYVYPTAINILYGGPAQRLSILNSSNYVDTFAEYIISLIMLIVVVVLPWFLLRIFRDYCCDGIYAMKNILLSMYDQMRGGPNSPIPQSPSQPANISTSLKMPKEIEVPIKVRLETAEDIKRAKTEDIARSLDVKVTRLTDVAHFETNKTTRETVSRNLNFLKNPISAETPTERQKYINLRTELFNRAVKDDQTAKQILSSISTSATEKVRQNHELLRTVPQSVPITHVVSIKVKMPESKVSSVTSSLVKSAADSPNVINAIAVKTGLQAAQVQSTLSSLNQHISEPIRDIVSSVALATGLGKTQVISILQTFTQAVHTDKDLSAQVAKLENINADEVENVADNQMPVIAEPEKHIEQTVSIPPSVSIEDYEQVKHMWQEQYEKGEVPISENITSREDWVEKDIVFITNTLNKILSVDQSLREEGLNDVGYIVPIFMINNLKGEELVVYLKAKIEAAKAVRESKEKEKEIAAKVAEKIEFVEVEKPKAEEAAKTMEMKNELKVPIDPSKKTS